MTASTTNHTETPPLGTLLRNALPALRMTKTSMDLSELLAKQDGGDFLRSVAEAVLQLNMETDVEGLIGAGKHDRADQRTTWRNGYRERALDTRLGTLNLKVPKLRQGSYFPGFLEPRKTSEKALVAVIQEAWIGGVSTRHVDELAHVSRGQHTVVADAIRQAFDQPDRTSAGATWRRVADQLRPRWPKLAELMDGSDHDVLAYMAFPRQHRTKLHSTNPIERLNKEVKRRADVVGPRRAILPLEGPLILLDPERGFHHPLDPLPGRAWRSHVPRGGAVLFEQNEEWQTASRYMMVEAFANIDHEETDPTLSITTQAACS